MYRVCVWVCLYALAGVFHKIFHAQFLKLQWRALTLMMSQLPSKVCSRGQLCDRAGQLRSCNKMALLVGKCIIDNCSCMISPSWQYIYVCFSWLGLGGVASVIVILMVVCRRITYREWKVAASVFIIYFHSDFMFISWLNDLIRMEQKIFYIPCG